MAYVPGCRYDLFISYASENNLDGWVEQFEGDLGRELGDLLGRQFSPRGSIYFDKRTLEEGQDFSSELAKAAQDSAILIPILSPGYLTSGWCSRERTEFFAKLPRGADKTSCLAPVLFRPVDEDGLDTLYRNAQRFSFLSPDGYMSLALRSPQGKARLAELAGQLAHVLQRLRQKCNPVFLGKAPANDRLQKLRSWCDLEMGRRYLRTVPESLPVLEDIDVITTTLESAALAVHFLGEGDDIAMKAIEASVAI